MAQRLQDDKIGTLSHSSGTISLGASRLTIGGQQYANTSALTRSIASDVTMVANTLYMIYAVVNSGVVELRISANVNSAGPAGFSSWKLVGAFYANSTPAFGTFMTIEGVPAGNPFSYGGVTTNLTNNTFAAFVRRTGSLATLSARWTFTGAPAVATNTQINTPASLTLDGSYIANVVVGYGRTEDAGSARYATQAVVITVNQFILRTLVVNATYATDADVTNTVPFSLNTGDIIDIEISFPVLGWSETPLKDL
jgi:hypothetical protein